MPGAPISRAAIEKRWKASTLSDTATPVCSALISGSTGNLYLSGNYALLAEHRLIDNTPNGTGDLLSALFLARLLEGLNEERALQLATAGVFEVIARSRKRGSDELTLEQDASSLSTPMAMVQMRRLLHPSQKKNR